MPNVATGIERAYQRALALLPVIDLLIIAGYWLIN
jgi:hypothetical protein